MASNWLFHFWTLPLWRVLLCHRLKVFPASLLCLNLSYSILNSLISSSAYSFCWLRNKYVISWAQTVLEDFWLGFTHFNTESTLTITLRAFSASGGWGTRGLKDRIYDILGFWRWVGMMLQHWLNQKTRLQWIQDHGLCCSLILDKYLLRAVLSALTAAWFILSWRDNLKLTATSWHIPVCVNKTLQVELGLSRDLTEISDSAHFRLCLHHHLLRREHNFRVGNHCLGEQFCLMKVSVALI